MNYWNMWCALVSLFIGAWWLCTGLAFFVGVRFSTTPNEIAGTRAGTGLALCAIAAFNLFMVWH